MEVGRPQGGVCTAEFLLNAPLCAFLSIMGGPSGQITSRAGGCLLGLF